MRTGRWKERYWMHENKYHEAQTVCRPVRQGKADELEGYDDWAEFEAKGSSRLDNEPEDVGEDDEQRMNAMLMMASATDGTLDSNGDHADVGQTIAAV